MCVITMCIYYGKIYGASHQSLLYLKYNLSSATFPFLPMILIQLGTVTVPDCSASTLRKKKLKGLKPIKCCSQPKIVTYRNLKIVIVFPDKIYCCGREKIDLLPPFRVTKNNPNRFTRISFYTNVKYELYRVGDKRTSKFQNAIF